MLMADAFDLSRIRKEVHHLIFDLFSDPTKYFGCELGAQTQFDLKNDRYIVNGAHDAAKLQDILDGFIKRCVLCQECENPETRLVSAHQNVEMWLVDTKRPHACPIEAALCSEQKRTLGVDELLIPQPFHTS